MLQILLFYNLEFENITKQKTFIWKNQGFQICRREECVFSLNVYTELALGEERGENNNIETVPILTLDLCFISNSNAWPI